MISSSSAPSKNRILLRCAPALACAWLALAPAGSAAGTAAANAVTVPEKWKQEAPAQGRLDLGALEKWWERFDDPILTALIGDALKSSPDLRTALARVEESRARHGVQRANLLPSLSASVSDSHTQARNRVTGTTTNSESAAASLDASWEIDLFGRQREAYKATAADLAQAEENLRAAQVTLVAEVAADYVSLRAAEADLRVVEKSVATQGETLQLVRWRQQAGVGNALDTQQAIASLEQAQASLPTLRQSATEMRNRLAVLCGMAPGALDERLGETGLVPTAPAAIAVGIPAETLQQRPDVRAALDAVAAAVARTAAAKRALWPSLSLSGSLGVDALKAGKLFDPRDTIANVVGGLTAPIFSGGSLRQTVRVQSAVEKQALLAYESTVLTALSDVENALSSVKRQAERLDSLDRAVAAAREASALADREYQAGQVDFLTVLDAERTLLGVEQQRVNTASDLTTAHIQLYKALGGGWSNL